MPKMPPPFSPSGDVGERRQAYEAERGSAASRGYGARWRIARKRKLAADPLCQYHALEGIVCAASLVDHLYPHRGDDAVFWFDAWWISSCASYHSTEKQATERAGLAAIDALADRLGLPRLATVFPAFASQWRRP